MGIDSKGLLQYHDLNINSYRRFRIFMLKKLNEYIDTEFVMTNSWDSFILNPDAWTDEFLKYDYIGAPVIWDPDKACYENEFHWRELNTGKGKFSIRSKRLLEVLVDPDIHEPTGGGVRLEYEDYTISKINRGFLEKVHGIKFAPYELCEKFSNYMGVWDGQFGFESFSTNLTNWKDAKKFGMEFLLEENFHKYYSYISKDLDLF